VWKEKQSGVQGGSVPWSLYQFPILTTACWWQKWHLLFEVSVWTQSLGDWIVVGHEILHLTRGIIYSLMAGGVETVHQWQ
jgi:hypothetical protein